MEKLNQRTPVKPVYNIRRITMKKLSYFMYLLLFLSMLTACATTGRRPSDHMLKPSDKVGDMTLGVTQDEWGVDPGLLDYCPSEFTESDPPVIIRECTVPQVPEIFIGMGIHASTVEELDSSWPTMVWELYLDGHPVDLSAFGTIDVDWGDKFRFLNVVLESPTPGLHRSRWIIRDADGEGEPTDVTWMFTVE
jgi:hypothetical protein